MQSIFGSEVGYFKTSIPCSTIQRFRRSGPVATDVQALLSTGIGTDVKTHICGKHGIHVIGPYT